MKPMATSHAGVADALRRAKASRVPVVTLDRLIDDEAVVSTVGTDNAKAQAAATEFAFERLVVHDGAVAEAIIAMGRTPSLTVVAQGVETHGQANFLRTHACDEFQGF